MAWGVVSVGTVKKGTTGNLANVALPVGHTTGHLLELWVMSADNATGTVTGYTLKSRFQNGTGAQVEVWYKWDGGSETTPTVTRSGTKVASSAFIIAYSGGAGSGDPYRDIQADTGTGTTLGNFSTTCAALTGVVSGDFGGALSLMTAPGTSGSAVIATPSGWTQQLATNQNVNGASLVAEKLSTNAAPAGSQLTGITESWNGATTPVWIGVQTALNGGGSGGQTVTPTGLDTTQSFGSVSTTTGGVTVAVTGRSSAQSFGSITTLKGGVSVSVTGKATSQAFGAIKANMAFNVPSLGSAQAFGLISLKFQVPSLASAQAFSSLIGLAFSVPSLGSAAAFGAPSVSTGGGGQSVSASGLGSAASFGSPTPSPGGVTSTVTGLGSAQAFGGVHENIAFNVPGLNTTQAFGAVSFSTGGVSIPIPGLGSGQQFGFPSVTTPGGVSFSPAIHGGKFR